MQCVSVYLCVFISSFVCRSVSLGGLIARQRTVHIPVRCLTTFELASELHDCSVCLGGLLVLFAPNFLQRPLPQLRCCRKVLETLHRSGGACLGLTYRA